MALLGKTLWLVCYPSKIWGVLGGNDAVRSLLPLEGALTRGADPRGGPVQVLMIPAMESDKSHPLRAL